MTTYTFGQGVVSSVNSGAISNNQLVYSVGDIFVIPTTNPDNANSGLIGALSRIDFFVTSVNNHLVSTDLRVFPNPTNGSVYFQNTDHNSFQKILIYDQTGRLMLKQNIQTNSVDLSSLPNGIYIVATDNQKISSFKIIKQ